ACRGGRQGTQLRGVAQPLSFPSARDGKKSENRLSVFPSCAETIRHRPAVSSCEPLFEKRRRLCAFDSASHCIQHAAAHRSAATIKTKPIGKIHFARLPHDIEPGLAKIEESTLANDTQQLPATYFLA